MSSRQPTDPAGSREEASPPSGRAPVVRKRAARPGKRQQRGRITSLRGVMGGVTHLEREIFLRSVPLFAELEDRHIHALSAMLAERRYRKGSVVFFEGDPGDALFIVSQGAVKIYRVAEDGREKTLAILRDGDIFGEMALLDEEPRSAIAECLEPTTLYALHRKEFLAFLANNPSMAIHIIKVLCGRLRRANAQVMDVVFRDVKSRIVRTLLDLSQRHGIPCRAGVRIDLKLTHQELASLVGTARETVTRILAEFQDTGFLTVDGRHLVIRDREALESLAVS